MIKKPSTLKEANISLVSSPYNLAEQVRQNTFDINTEKKDIVLLKLKDIDLQNQIDNISGGGETNTIVVSNPTEESLNEKTKQNEVNTEFVEEFKKIENGEISYPQLELNGEIITEWPETGISNSSDVIDNSIEIPNEGINPWKQAIDNNTTNINLKANKSDLDDLTSQVEENTEDITKLINGETPLNVSSSDINDDNTTFPLEGINPWKTQINENISSINTLNGLIQQYFNTYGNYTSTLGIAIDQTIRPLLTEITGLDPNYVEVSLTPNPNSFTNLADGKIIFTINFSNLKNELAEESTLTMNVYQNDTNIFSKSQIIEANWIGSNTLVEAIDVLANGIVYFEFIIDGSLSVDAPIKYFINFESNTQVQASKSSEIIDDSSTLPTSGLNPWKTQINTNVTNIANNTAELLNKVDTTYAYPIYPTQVGEIGYTTAGENGGFPYLKRTNNNTYGMLRVHTTFASIIDQNENPLMPANPENITPKIYVDTITDQLNTKIITNTTNINSKADQEDVDALDNRITTNETDIALKANQTDLDTLNDSVVENTTFINSIEDGTYNFNSLTLNGDLITEWPSGGGGSESSSLITDDSVTLPTEGINPWKTQIDTNTSSLTEINDIIINSFSEVGSFTSDSYYLNNNTHIPSIFVVIPMDAEYMTYDLDPANNKFYPQKEGSITFNATFKGLKNILDSNSTLNFNLFKGGQPLSTKSITVAPNFEGDVIASITADTSPDLYMNVSYGAVGTIQFNGVNYSINYASGIDKGKLSSTIIDDSYGKESLGINSWKQEIEELKSGVVMVNKTYKNNDLIIYQLEERIEKIEDLLNEIKEKVDILW